MTRILPRAPHEAGRRLWVRVAVPAGGFGGQLAIMRAWLDQTCGAAGWTMAPSGLADVANDALAFYFVDRRLACAFIDRFCCGYRIGDRAAASPVPAVTMLSSPQGRRAG